MIILQFEKNERQAFESIFATGSYDSNYISSKKIAGDEVVLQVVLTTVSIVSPFVIQFFINQRKKGKSIKLIKQGIEMTFESEEDLQKYLDSLEKTHLDSKK